jgi:hypothetical protein
VNLVRINASPWEAMGNGEPFQYLWVP